MFIARTAKFGIGQVVRHRSQGFRGVVIDVDPEYGGRTAWLSAATEGERPDLDQPFYHLLAEAGDDSCIAYVSEETLEADDSGQPVRHPQLAQLFAGFERDRYVTRTTLVN